MNDVAEAAGVTKPVLYQHFASKRDLYAVMLDHVGSQLLALLDAAAGAGGPRQQVETGFAAFFGFVAEHPSAYRALFWGANRGDPEFGVPLDRVEESMARVVAELIDADLDDEHRRTLAYGVIGLAEVVSRTWMIGGMQTPPELLARQVADLAWSGLRGVHRLG